MIETCSVCGFSGEHAFYIPHDCYWELRKKRIRPVGRDGEAMKPEELLLKVYEVTVISTTVYRFEATSEEEARASVALMTDEEIVYTNVDIDVRDTV